MIYLVEFQVKPNSKNQILEKFDLRGPNRIPGVRFRQAWISTQQDVIYAIGDADDETVLRKACSVWDEFGTYSYTQVVDIENF